jgi:thiol-disulfide isomerase/thioredoxin
MRNLMLIAAAFLLLFGCASQKPGYEAPQAPGSTQQEQAALPAIQQEKVSTASLSFSRDTSGVMNTDTEFPKPPVFDFSPVKDADGKLIVYYFYSPNCVASKAIAPEIDRMEAAYSGVDFIRYDITTQNGTLAYVEFAKEYNLSTDQRLVPQVLVNRTIITDRFNINDSLEGIISAS